MKFTGFILLFVLIAACDPYNFGFKKNPAYVLDEAFMAITNLDKESFLEVTAREVLCIYGNDKGLQYLKDKILLNPEEVKLVPQILSKKRNPKPVFVGYWSYYHERYQIDVIEKESRAEILTAIVDCHYGYEGVKDDSQANLPPESYKKKECRGVKIVSQKFASLPLPQKCQQLKVEL